MTLTIVSGVGGLGRGRCYELIAYFMVLTFALSSIRIILAQRKALTAVSYKGAGIFTKRALRKAQSKLSLST